MFPMKEEGCMAHMMRPEDVTFCEAIQQLYDEHQPLRDQMNQLLDKSAAIVEEKDYLVPLQELCELEKVFKKELLIHSEKEENGLFPMVGKYIGTQAGPIAVMEYEHSEGKRNLDEFESRTAGNLSGDDTLELEAVKQTIEPLMEACHILLNHFMKEENVLFPMGEQLLNGQEKDELLKIVKPVL